MEENYYYYYHHHHHYYFVVGIETRNGLDGPGIESL